MTLLDSMFLKCKSGELHLHHVYSNMDVQSQFSVIISQFQHSWEAHPLTTPACDLAPVLTTLTETYWHCLWGLGQLIALTYILACLLVGC